MSEFIKIKNDTGDGEMIIKAALVLRVCDREEGGSVVEYGEDFNDNGKNYEVFRTGSTAAEVLAAIEGAQGLEFKQGAAAVPLVTLARDDDTMAVVCAGQMLGRELEARTGERWGVTVQPVRLSVPGRGFRFDCSWQAFQKSTDSYGGQYFSEMEDGGMAEWAQEIAERMVGDALRYQPIVLASPAIIPTAHYSPLRPGMVGVGKGREGGDTGKGFVAPPCTCGELILGHDPDCPWHGG